MTDAPTAPVADLAALRRCIILVAPGAPRPERLIQALQQRSIEVDLVADAPQAMAALVSEGPHAVIVQTPDKHQNVARLFNAVRRYHPTAICWQYDETGAGLQPYGNPAPAQTPPAERPQPAPPAQPEPEAAASVEEPSPPKPKRKAPAAAAQLSPDELAMLLGSSLRDEDEDEDEDERP